MLLIPALILILCLPVIGLLVTGLFLNLSQNSSKWELWKFPPVSRKGQFLFSLGNILVLAPTMFFFWPFILLGFSGSWHKILIFLWIILILTNSTIALFRPRYTVGIFILYFLITINFYFDLTHSKRTTAYIDICNELRTDPNCVESKYDFICNAHSFRGAFKASKDICFNKTAGNDEYDFQEYKSSLLGRTFTTMAPLLYIKNLPRNNCRNRQCGFKTETIINEMHNICSNCLREEEITTRLRMDYLPESSRLKVIDSFSINSNSWSYIRSDQFLILEDQDGNRSEVRENMFDTFLLRGGINQPGKQGKVVLDDIALIKSHGWIEKNYCFINSERWPYLDEFKNRLVNFIRVFQIETELEISGPVEWSKQGKDYACANLIFKTENSYLLGHYYFETLDLSHRKDSELLQPHE